MTSKVEIFNKALFHLGEERVDNVEDSKLSHIYDIVLDKALIMAPWRFANHRQELSQLSGETNLTPYDYVYNLPTLPFCLKPLQINNSDSQEFIIEGTKLYTDEGVVNLKYTKRVTNTDEFSPEFVDVISLILAVDGCYQITGSRTLKESLYEELIESLSRAASLNSSRGYIKNRIKSNVLDKRL